MEKTGWIAIVGCVIAVIALSLTSFNMIAQNISAVSSSHNMGGMSGGMGSMGGGHDMGGMDHSMTSSTQQVCKPAGGMPPHYCEPIYMTMSSVPGIKISKVEPVSATEVKAIIKEATNTKVSQKLVLVGGSGYLSGATIIEDGWSKTKTVHLKFDGKGTIYDFTEMHLHLFPYTRIIH
jgi:hypothetical protein